MAKIRVYNLGSLNLKVSPFLQKEGELIRALNVERDTYGGWRKRPGYITYLGTPDSSTVDSLFNWTKEDGSSFWNYRASGGVLRYSAQGTGAWTVCTNGTLTAGAPVGHAVQKDTLIIGDGTAATKHTTSGTSFTDTSGAPKGQFFAEYQNRVFIGGTGAVLTYSVTNDATNWQTTGTSDSSSLNITGPGKINQVFRANDRIVINKTSQNMFRWDGFSLVQVPTDQGLSSPHSLASVEDFWFYLNRNGFFAYNGDRPQLISNPISRQIYNDAGSGIAGTTFDNAPAVVHGYKYLCSVGTISDDLTNNTIPNAITVYDYAHNEWSNYQYANRPTSWMSFKDNNGSQTLVFGAANGQCYQVSGTATTDNGATIEAVLEGVIHLGVPESDKEWRYMWAFFNPGAQAKIQVATANTFTSSKKKWVDLGDCVDGVAEFRFPPGSQSKLLFWKIYEASRDARFHFYGFSIEANVEDKK